MSDSTRLSTSHLPSIPTGMQALSSSQVMPTPDSKLQQPEQEAKQEAKQDAKQEPKQEATQEPKQESEQEAKREAKQELKQEAKQGKGEEKAKQGKGEEKATPNPALNHDTKKEKESVELRLPILTTPTVSKDEVKQTSMVDAHEIASEIRVTLLDSKEAVTRFLEEKKHMLKVLWVFMVNCGPCQAFIPTFKRLVPSRSQVSTRHEENEPVLFGMIDGPRFSGQRYPTPFPRDPTKAGKLMNPDAPDLIGMFPPDFRSSIEGFPSILVLDGKSNRYFRSVHYTLRQDSRLLLASLEWMARKLKYDSILSQFANGFSNSDISWVKQFLLDVKQMVPDDWMEKHLMPKSSKPAAQQVQLQQGTFLLEIGSKVETSQTAIACTAFANMLNRYGQRWKRVVISQSPHNECVRAWVRDDKDEKNIDALNLLTGMFRLASGTKVPAEAVRVHERVLAASTSSAVPFPTTDSKSSTRPISTAAPFM